MSKSLNTLWLPSTIEERLLAEADDKYDSETGGILMGYRLNGSQYVVQDVIGPGPNASHQRNWFEPDYDYHDQEIGRAFKGSGGVSTYLGDWHTHPDGAARLSPKDRRTLIRIARTPEAQAPCPVMLLASGSPGRWRINAWCCLQHRLLRLPRFSVVRLNLQRFE